MTTTVSRLMPSLILPDGITLAELDIYGGRDHVRGTWEVLHDGEPIGKLTVVRDSDDRVLVSRPGWCLRTKLPNAAMNALLNHAGVER